MVGIRRLAVIHGGEIGVLPITLALIAKALALNSIPLGNARQLLDECIIGCDGSLDHAGCRRVFIEANGLQ